MARFGSFQAGLYWSVVGRKADIKSVQSIRIQIPEDQGLDSGEPSHFFQLTFDIFQLSFGRNFSHEASDEAISS